VKKGKVGEKKIQIEVELPYTHFKILERIAYSMHCDVEDVIQQALQEYIVRYVMQIYKHLS
jgi:hypothetical protein